MQILQTIHIENVWVMLWELIAASAIVWAKYKKSCFPLRTSYLWVKFEGRTFTLITLRSERVKISQETKPILQNTGNRDLIILVLKSKKTWADNISATHECLVEVHC